MGVLGTFHLTIQVITDQDDRRVYRWPITSTRWCPLRRNPERLHRPGLPRAGIDGAAARPKRHSLKQSVVFVTAAAKDPEPSSVLFDIMSLFSWAGGTSAQHRQGSFSSAGGRHDDDAGRNPLVAMRCELGPSPASPPGVFPRRLSQAMIDLRYHCRGASTRLHSVLSTSTLGRDQCQVHSPGCLHCAQLAHPCKPGGASGQNRVCACSRA